MLQAISTVLLAGAGFGVLFVFFARARRKKELPTLAFGLVVAAFIYAAFAMNTGPAWWVLTEFGQLTVVTLICMLALRKSPALLGVAWLAHMGWDAFFHMTRPETLVPAWYPVACLGFDLVVGVYILAWGRRRSPGTRVANDPNAT